MAITRVEWASGMKAYLIVHILSYHNVSLGWLDSFAATTTASGEVQMQGSEVLLQSVEKSQRVDGR